jgi:hypothetical protein
MLSVKGLKSYFFVLFLILCKNLIAQPELAYYSDFGKNNLSDEIYFKSVVLGHYKTGKNSFETGFQTELSNLNKLSPSGLRIDASRVLDIKGIHMELHGFFLLTTFSLIIRETNWGALLKYRQNRFRLTVGTNFRTYAFTNKAIREYMIDKKSSKIHENFNVLYSIAYYINPTDEIWNVGLSLTNIDYFCLNQETNAGLNLNCIYKITPPLCLFSQACYQSAGATNLQVNYFGFFIRTGMIWNFNLKN